MRVFSIRRRIHWKICNLKKQFIFPQYASFDPVRFRHNWLAFHLVPVTYARTWVHRQQPSVRLELLFCEDAVASLFSARQDDPWCSLSLAPLFHLYVYVSPPVVLYCQICWPKVGRLRLAFGVNVKFNAHRVQWIQWVTLTKSEWIARFKIVPRLLFMSKYGWLRF